MLWPGPAEAKQGERGDPVTRREQAMLIFFVWVCVYPSVLLFSYAFRWLGIDVALWIELAISTAVSVPLISAVAIPQVEKVVARANHETPAELKLRQAREADGPDPEEQV